MNVGDVDAEIATAPPVLGLRPEQDGRDYSLGWWLANANGAPGGSALELAAEAQRRETDADPTVLTQHTVDFRVTSRFQAAPPASSVLFPLCFLFWDGRCRMQQQIEGFYDRMAILWRPRHATSPIIAAKLTRIGSKAADSVLGDFVIEPALDDLSDTDVHQIVERCFRQLFVTGEIEQAPRRVI